ACSLCCVDPPMRQQEKFLDRRVQAFIERGTPCASSDAYCLGFELYRRRFNHDADSLGHDRSTECVNVPQQKNERLASVASEHVLAPEFFTHGVRDMSQHSIANDVTMRVVYLLEVIDVQDHYGKQRIPANGESNLQTEPLLEVSAVVSTG